MSGERRFDPDDPRLSAYALGELPEHERAEVEELLARDERAREFVRGLEETARALADEYAESGDDALLADQRERVLSPPARLLRHGRHRGRLAALAASLLALLVAGSLWQAFRPAFRAGIPAEAVPTGGDTVRGQPSDALRKLGYLGGAVAASAPAPGTSAPVGRVDFRRVEVVDETEALHGAGEFDTESYDETPENPFRRAADDARSTFSIDVDTASYTNARRFLLREGRLPPPSSVRIEEFVNYFTYDYPEPDPGEPFSVSTEVVRCPWSPAHQLVRIGLKGRSVAAENRKPANLVFLIDVSGSMQGQDKLPLLVRAMKLLVEQLDARDRIAIVVYAGQSGLVLPSTSGDRHGEIVGTLDRLSAGGSTNGGAGIELAYRVAEENRIDGGINRVILCTDGDFNVGVTDRGSLVRLIEKKRETGVFLTVLGFGTGNLKDDTMERLADKGNGQYAYIDSLLEARRVLVEQVGGTLEVIAKDVKVQVEFNPGAVEAWRLIGYENRLLAHQDFNDDTRDAGEIGAGVAVTALYEVVPKGVPFDGPGVDPSRYRPEPRPPVGHADELLFLRLRYKEPDGSESRLIETPVLRGDREFRAASEDTRFAVAVAGFAMLLRESPYAGDLTFDLVRAYAQESVGEDRGGYRREFLQLVDRARELARGH